MYSCEDRMRAVELYIKYGCHSAAVIRELGYPNHHTLLYWYDEYQKNRKLHIKRKSTQRYSTEQKQAALSFYTEHGRSIAYTIKTLGYPSTTLFKMWLNEAFPDRKKRCVSGGAMVEYSQETKQQAVIDLCARKSSAQEVAKAHGVSRVTLYKWKGQLLGEERSTAMPKKKVSQADEAEALEQRIADLRAEEASMNEKLFRAQLEYDILEKAAELLKKGLGINLKSLTNREKAALIDALRPQYRLNLLLQEISISKSSYCYQEKSLHVQDRYAQVRAKIHEIFSASRRTYGYRRIYKCLENEGIAVSEKVVRRIMCEESLVVYRKKRKKYSSYVGEVSPAVPNILNRDFHAEAPNVKWLTDITEFGLPAGKVYLSPIIDCFDGLPISWTIGTSPSAELANTMLDGAISILKEGERPIIHSDRGGHYRWPGWIERMEVAQLTRSMSKKGCSPDNSACEGFFGRLKNEMFYGTSWQDVSIDEFISVLDDYMHWYCETRIKLSLGGMSPLEYRRSLGLSANNINPAAPIAVA